MTPSLATAHLGAVWTATWRGARDCFGSPNFGDNTEDGSVVQDILAITSGKASSIC